MTKISIQSGPPLEIFWYLNGRRKARIAKKLRDNNIRKRAGAQLSHIVRHTPGIDEKDSRVIKATARRLNVSTWAKKQIFERLTMYKRMNYEAIRLRIRKPATARTSTHLRSVMIHPTQLEWYQQNYEVVEIIRGTDNA